MQKSSGAVEVDVQKIRGIRRGVLSDGNIYAEYPSQAMTTTNINHMRVVGNMAIDFGTRFLEIPFRKDISLLDKSIWYADEVKRVKKIAEGNTDKFCFMHVTSAKSRRFTKAENEFLIKMQLEMSLHFVRVYMKKNRNALSDLNHYLDLIPEGCYLVPVLDEALKPEVFAQIYMRCLEVHLPVVGFIGRDLSRSNTNIKRNYLLIGSRPNDGAVRIVADMPRRTSTGKPKPLLFQHLGYDVFSLASRATRYRLTNQPLKVVWGLEYVDLDSHKSIPCPLNLGQTLFQTSTQYKVDGKETVPCSIHSLIEMNKNFRKLHTITTYDELEKLLALDLAVLNQD